MSLPTLAEATNIPVIHMADAKAGDAVFCDSGDLIGSAIQLGQKLKRFAPEYRKWNHVAWLDTPVLAPNGEGIVDWHIGQAVGHGVTNSSLLSTVAPHGQHEIVSLDSFPTIIEGDTVNRPAALATLRMMVGDDYGWLTIGSEIFNILTPQFVHVDFRRDKTWICSALYSYGLLSGGGFIEGDVYQVMPAQVASWAQARAVGVLK